MRCWLGRRCLLRCLVALTLSGPPVTCPHPFSLLFWRFSVANHASSEKRARQSLKRAARNRHVRSTLRGYVRAVRDALTAGDAAAAQKVLPTAIAQIDKAVSKGVYPRKTGSRYISRLAAQLSALTKG